MDTDGQLNPVSRTEDRTDEIDVTQILLIIWSHKRWIAACTAIFTVLGVIYAILVTPQYYSQATLMLKDSKGGGASGIFSQLGGVGGAAASQLGLGNTNVPKLTIILKSEELAESVIQANDLMPVLYPNLWDGARGKWKESAKIPTVRKGGMKLSKMLNVEGNDKVGIMYIGVTLYDSVYAKRIVDAYLTALNQRIRINVMADADSNRKYLERQLIGTSDPTVIEKIQSLIANEIEKAMLMSSSSFEVLESPRVPLIKSYPKKKMLVIGFFIAGLIFSIGSIFAWKGIQTFRRVVTEARTLQPRESKG